MFSPWKISNSNLKQSIGQYHNVHPCQQNQFLGLIVIYETRQISWKKLDFAKFCKLQEAILLTVIDEIFKFPPHFNPFGYENYLRELSLG